jgi:DNA replication protein
MNEYDKLLLRHALAQGMGEGTAAVPVLLLKHYRGLKLSDGEAMLLVHLLSFTEKEHKPFPTIEEIQERMSAPPDKVIAALQKLVKNGFVQIDEGTDPLSGKKFEVYNLVPLYIKLAERAAAEMEGNLPARPVSLSPGKDDLYSAFEQEFGRPLTPMELEMITGWIEQDRYPEELIRFALKEAVFAGKLHFRYVDRILVNWRKNKVSTTQQAKEHAKQYRGAR